MYVGGPGNSTKFPFFNRSACLVQTCASGKRLHPLCAHYVCMKQNLIRMVRLMTSARVVEAAIPTQTPRTQGYFNKQFGNIPRISPCGQRRNDNS